MSVVPREVQKTAEIGQLVGDRYRVTGILGRGGMGSVFRAERTEDGTPVALKLLHRAVADRPDLVKRFQREAFATELAQHPNCVTVTEFGETGEGSLYLALELVEGRPLSELLDSSSSLPWRRALHIVRHVMRGLAHAHAAGVIHRDIKPDNILLCEVDGDADFAKILDFGIAKLVDGAPVNPETNELTRIGTTMGTPTYISPEQAFGQPVDARTDIYSASVMAYEMLAGRPPFVAEDTLELLTQHAAGDIPRFAAVARGVEIPAEVEDLVRRGLAKDADDRVASAREYIAEIDRMLGRVSGVGVAMTTPLPHLSSDDVPVPMSSDGVPVPMSSDQVPVAPIANTGPVPMTESGPIPRATHSVTIGPVPPGRWRWTRRNVAFAVAGGLALLLTLSLALSGSGPPKGAARPDKIHHDVPPKEMLERGHERTQKRDYDGALAAYNEAVFRDAELADDARMRKNVERISRKAQAETAVDALELQIRVFHDEDARKRLVEMASSGRHAGHRHAARSKAEVLDLAGEIDYLSSYALDLRQGSDCDERRDAVKKLRDLEDERAIEILENNRRRRSGGLLGFGGRNKNKCIEEDIDAAIEHLESL